MLPLGALGAAGDEQVDLTPPVEADLPGGASRLGLYDADLGSADPRDDPPKWLMPRKALP
jgi:hypothetical protein